MPTVKKYPIIGGPLNGEYGNRNDFYSAYSSPTNPGWFREGGRWADYRKDYITFNAGDRVSPSSMIWLYVPLIPPSRRMKQ